MIRIHKRSVSADDVLTPAPHATTEGHLEVARQKGRVRDRFRAYHIIIDKKDIGEIRRGQSLVFSLPAGRHEVHLEIDWCRSPSMIVELQVGQTTSLVCQPNIGAGRAMQALRRPDDWITLVRREDIR